MQAQDQDTRDVEERHSVVLVFKKSRGRREGKHRNPAEKVFGEFSVEFWKLDNVRIGVENDRACARALTIVFSAIRAA
jgi:hypothetical protein